jgi:hypothetical protein
VFSIDKARRSGRKKIEASLAAVGGARSGRDKAARSRFLREQKDRREVRLK